MPLTKDSTSQKQATPTSVDEEYSQNGLLYDASKTALTCTAAIAFFCVEYGYYGGNSVNFKLLFIAIAALFLRAVLQFIKQNR